MRDYQKPIIEDEEIDIEDICTTSFEQPQESFMTDDDTVSI